MANKLESCDALRTRKPGAETIRWGIAESPFGTMFLAESPCGITHLSFFDADEKEALGVLQGDRPDARLLRDDAFAGKMAKRIFSGKCDAPLDLAGTPFQRKVWQALREIPAGRTTTYGRLAQKIGMPGAARAVGNAVGANRISHLIPCHRVIRGNGGLGGYRWGTHRKREMLSREGVKLPAPR